MMVSLLEVKIFIVIKIYFVLPFFTKKRQGTYPSGRMTRTAGEKSALFPFQ